MLQISCLLEGGQLAEIETIAEDYFLRGQLLGTFGRGHRFWVGGTDNHTEGRWVWGKSARKIEYTGWGPNEPNSYAGVDEDCMDMDGIDYAKYSWNDEPCTLLEQSICEKAL